MPGHADGGDGTGPRDRRASPRRRAPATAGRALGLLGPDALALLDALGEVRFLTVAQAARLGGEGDPARSLRALARAGLVVAQPYRPEPLAALVRVWSLTALGARAAVARASHAAGEGGLADPGLARRARHLAADALSTLFLAHALAVADIYVAVRGRAEAPFAWRAGEDARVRFRSLAAPGGRGVLVPDAVVAPAGLPYGDDPLAMGGVALEIDRATMGRAAVDRKLLRYRERVADRGPFGPVLFVAEASERRRWLEARLAAAGIEGSALDPERAAEAAVRAVARIGAPASPA